MAIKPIPPQELLRQLLRYEPETGKLFWKDRPAGMFRAEQYAKAWNKRCAGKEAFTSYSNIGYLRGRIFSQDYLAHRVIWALYHGWSPVQQIDHINGIRGDNRIKNLREVSNKENGKNRRISTNNTTGFIGVIKNKNTGRFQARIYVDGKHKSLGYFALAEDAAKARKIAEERHGFHKNHGKLLKNP